MDVYQYSTDILVDLVLIEGIYRIDEKRIITRTAFWEKADRNRVCWEWQGSRYFPPGFPYGRLCVQRKTFKAHRLAWLLTFGDIPKGFCVCHTCDNPPCVRPSHLFLGTNADNTLDRDRKGRQAKGEKHGAYTKPYRLASGDRHGFYLHPERTPRGERNGHAKLTAQEVMAIRERVANGEMKARLAPEYGVTDVTISSIVLGQTWRHLL